MTEKTKVPASVVKRVAAAIEKDEKGRAQLSTMKYPIPPPQKASIVADPSEVLALRVVVGCLVGILATLIEKQTGKPPQSVVNDWSEICQKALLSAEIVASDGRDVETLRRDAINHVNKILAVKFDSGRATTN